MTSIIRLPHSDHIKYFPNIAKVYVMASLIKPPTYAVAYFKIKNTSGVWSMLPGIQVMPLPVF